MLTPALRAASPIVNSLMLKHGLRTAVRSQVGNLRIPRRGLGSLPLQINARARRDRRGSGIRAGGRVPALGEIDYDLPHRGKFVDFAVASTKTRSLSQRVT